MKIAYIIRGLPGSGKTTLAQKLAPKSNVAADDWFDFFNDGVFNPEKLKRAHQWCKEVFTEFCQENDEFVAVHNTFTQNWEYQPYIDIAEKHGYVVHVIVVENHHGNESVHGVPKDAINKMRNRFEINL